MPAIPPSTGAHSARRWLALAAATTTALAAMSSTGISVAKKDSDEWVTICHRTNSTKNPYVVITVKESAVDGINGKGEGQGDHYGTHTGPIWEAGMPNGGGWGDIIPPVAGAHGDIIPPVAGAHGDIIPPVAGAHGDIIPPVAGAHGGLHWDARPGHLGCWLPYRIGDPRGDDGQRWRWHAGLTGPR